MSLCYTVIVYTLTDTLPQSHCVHSVVRLCACAPVTVCSHPDTETLLASVTVRDCDSASRDGDCDCVGVCVHSRPHREDGGETACF